MKGRAAAGRRGGAASAAPCPVVNTPSASPCRAMSARNALAALARWAAASAAAAASSAASSAASAPRTRRRSAAASAASAAAAAAAGIRWLTPPTGSRRRKPTFARRPFSSRSGVPLSSAALVLQSSNSLAVRVGVRVRVRVRVRVTRGLGLVGLGLGLGLESPAGPLLRSDKLVADAPRVLVVRAGELAVGIRRLARGAATIEPAVKVVVQQLGIGLGARLGLGLGLG